MRLDIYIHSLTRRVNDFPSLILLSGRSFKIFPTPVHFSSSATRQVPPDSPLGTGREIVRAEGRVKEGSMKTRRGKRGLTYLRPHEDGWRRKLLPCRLSFRRLARRRELSEGRIFHLLLRVQMVSGTFFPPSFFVLLSYLLFFL